MILKSALFLELGWEPVYTFMNRQRVAYYARFQNLADDRLCKVMEIKQSIHGTQTVLKPNAIKRLQNLTC
jgi:hypothetical protein